MGFDVNRFESVVSDEFLCAICTDVLDEPLVTPHCEHVFCGACIKYWLASGPTNAEPCCPIDRTPATVESLRAPLRSFRNLLLGQSIRCAFSPACSVYVKLNNLADHEAACNYNPVNIEKEVECENKCGARYKMQNKDKHNCVAYLQREMKAAEERFRLDGDRLRQLEKENGKLTKRLEEGRRKWEESRLVARNELQLNEEVNANLRRQLEEAHEEIARLKGQAAVAKASKGLRSRAVSATSASNGGGTSTLSSSGAAASASNRPRSIATSPKDSNNHQTVVASNSLSVDTALLVDLGEFGSNSSNSNSSSNNGVYLLNGETSGSSARLSNSKFYSTSSSNISTGTVRSNESGHSSSDSGGGGGGHHSNRSSTESTTNVVKNIQEFFNRISLPKITSPSPQSLPPSSSSITSSASPSSTSTLASASASSPPPVPPPKPPKPKPATTVATTNHHSNNHNHNNNHNINHQNGNNNSSSHSNYANIDITSTYPSTSHSLTVLPLANGLTSGSATNSSNNSSSSLPPTLPPPSPTSLEQLIEDSCKKQRILQVLKMVNRRHFFPANEYYKAAATKKGAHSFTLAYEIRLLEILESYITSESRVLDIGSGMGFIAVCLAHLAKTVIGLEHVKGLVTRATEVVNSHYGNLAQQGSRHSNNVVFFPEDGRYGLDRLGPYDLILVEPMVRQHVPDVILRQLKPGGCVVAVVKTDARLAMFRITVNRQKQTVYQTLIDDGAYLAAQHKDYLCDIRQQEMPFLNKFKSLQL